MQLQHLRNSEIDYLRWDECIAQSHNSLTYACSWYLDIVSPGWEALVTTDYDYVMPLPVKSRYKIPYLVQPVLTQQSGIFSPHKIDEPIIEEFIKAIPYYSYELNLNEGNIYPKGITFPNLTLSLLPSYEKLSSQYSKNNLRNIEKGTRLKLQISDNLTASEFISFFNSVEKHYVPVRTAILEKLIVKGLSEHAITLYGVYSAKDELIAALCLLHSDTRLTYLVPVSSAEGKASSAMFMLIDHIIRKEAGTNKLFDFEGSRIEGIARFYRGFGAKNHPYYILKRFRPGFLINK